MVYLSEETEEIDQAEEKTDRAEITEQPEESRQDPMRSMKNATQNPVGGQPVMSKSASSAETQTQITAPASAAPCPSRPQNSQTARTNAAPAPMVSPELENPEVLRYLQETEDLAADPEKLWEELKKSYPKIQPFEYEDGCDILTIRPQDIGKLPREVLDPRKQQLSSPRLLQFPLPDPRKTRRKQKESPIPLRGSGPLLQQ